jgi:hypothetical protein
MRRDITAKRRSTMKRAIMKPPPITRTRRMDIINTRPITPAKQRSSTSSTTDTRRRLRAPKQEISRCSATAPSWLGGAKVRHRVGPFALRAAVAVGPRQEGRWRSVCSRLGFCPPVGSSVHAALAGHDGETLSGPQRCAALLGKKLQLAIDPVRLFTRPVSDVASVIF